MPLRDDEYFAIKSLLSGQGSWGASVVAVIDAMCSVEREDTGVGFLSTVALPPDTLASAPISSANKTFTINATGQLVSFDLFVRAADRLDLEGVVFTGEWPNPFEPGDLSEG